MHTPASPNNDRTHSSARPLARPLRLRRSMTALWCATALCVAAVACSDASPTAPGGAVSAPSAAAGSDATASGDDATASGAGSAGGEWSAADAAWAYAEALAAEGWSEEVVAEAEARAAALEDEGSSGEFVPVPPKPMVRVLAFGSVHGDGRSEPEPLPGVTVAAVPSRRWGDWWATLTGLDFSDGTVPGIFYNGKFRLPPGAQYHGDTQAALRTSGVVAATTDVDGTAELWLNPGRFYYVCALSPETEGLIAGCELSFSPDSYFNATSHNGLNAIHDNAMVYFSHGRAYLGVDRDPGDYRGRFWFQRIAESVFGDLSAPAPKAFAPRPKQGLATVEFYSQEHNNPAWEHAMALIADSQVGAWWEAINTVTRDEYGRGMDRAAVESSPAMVVPFVPDPTVNEDLLAAVTVEAGTYLVCWLPAWSVDGERARLDVCAYEEFPADSRNYLDLSSAEFSNHLRRLTHPRSPG